MNELIIKGREGIKRGLNKFLDHKRNKKIGMNFSLCFLFPREKINFQTKKFETLLIVLKGKGKFFIADKFFYFERENFIEYNPVSIHIPCSSYLEISSVEESEIAIVQIPNNEKFNYRFLSPSETRIENRGKGVQDNTAYRIVRTIIDIENSPPQSKLVAGEVLNFQGRWSSYPPHHHPQPEFYYYRFEKESGFGFGELGDKVYKIFNHDILCITDNKDHSQVSAPGYKMFYIWAIRHLEGNLYRGFEFNEVHRSVFEGGEKWQK